MSLCDHACFNHEGKEKTKCADCFTVKMFSKPTSLLFSKYQFRFQYLFLVISQCVSTELLLRVVNSALFII